MPYTFPLTAISWGPLALVSGVLAELAPVIGIPAAAAGISGALLAWYYARPTKQRMEVEREKLLEELQTRVVKSVSEDMQRAREEVLRERQRSAEAIASQAQAQSTLAHTQAELAAALARASEERHELQNEITAKAARIRLLEILIREKDEEISVLNEKIQTLKTRLGENPDRRRG